jgi:hypothetical protein
MPSKAFSQANLLGTDNTLQATSLSTDIPITELYANIDELPASGTLGEQAFVQSTNRLYIWNGSGWYNIALINTTPTWDSGGQPAASYELDADSPQSSVTITLSASDPEGIPITYSYITSGQMDSMSTISQDSSIFTISPKTVTEVGEGVELTGSITFRASDGINILPQVSSFTLSFIGIIENSRYTTLLMTVTGASDNNNITDASTNNHTITVNGDAHAGTFSPYRSGGYSVYLPAINGGSEHNISFDHDAGFNFGSGDFTIEFSVYFPSNSTSTDYLFQHGESTGSWNVNTYNGVVTLWLNGISIGSDVLADSSNTISNNLNKWIYYAIVRSGTTVTMYRNGTSIATKTSAQNANVGATLDTTNSEYLHINRRRAGIGDGTEFYFKDFRVTKGLARTITAITEPLTSDVNTSILVGNLPYMGDASSNSHTATYIGSPSIEPFSPYDYEEYSATNHGGSVFFDGDPDHLQGPSVDLMGSGAFTVECWAYILSTITNSTDAFLAQYQTNNKFIFGVKADVVRVWMAAVEVRVGTTNITNNGWHHFALVRDDNNSCQLYIDGNEEGAAFTNSTDFSTSLENFQIGSWDGGVNSDLHGHISDLRVVRGTSVYTSAFTPPIAPLSTISGTTLHIKGTDASIIDKSQSANLKLIGNTTGSTTQVKFSNTKSMYFDGTGDEINAGRSIIPVGFSDFTVEGWVNFSNLSGQQFICIQAPNGTTTTTTFMIYLANSKIYNQWGSGSAYIETGILSANTWYHFASVHDSANSLVYFYLDGSSVGSFSSGLRSIGDYVFDIGARDSALFLNGYLQDLRVSSYARYTTNFTPPTASLEG